MNFKLSILLFLQCISLVTLNISAQTIVSGNISGIWNIEGSPYRLIDDCTVLTSTELTIEPGVTIDIGKSKSLHVYGKILANGTSNQPIIFKTLSSDDKYAMIHVQNGTSNPPMSEFTYCKFSNAEIGLYLHAYGRIDNDYTTTQTQVSNCSFDGSVSTAIYVRAQAVDASQYMTPRRRHAKVNPIINGCTFNDNEVGIEMYMQGSGSAWFSTGSTEATIQNNAFFNLSEAAINMLTGTLNSGKPSFVNNTIVNCKRGIWIQDADFDAITINNIFCNTDTAIERTGSNSSTAFYNCFHNNTIDFAGYPDTYGDIVTSNANGDPCDMGNNIYLDPSFSSTDDYILSDNSPCIGAGAKSVSINETSYSCPSTDIDGNLRPNPTDSNPDIGAFENDKNTTSIKTNDFNFDLIGNSPNPFKQSTVIKFQVSKLSFVKISIYNANGRKIKTIINEVMIPGYHTVKWNANNNNPGIYFIKISSGKFSDTRKCLLMK